ncbi:MAG: uracil phosphoribosyltransferase, partial [Acetobacteraceae bacterium]|nr:uracil phosphoribosyltransferase [Acetobacteraceae bacterium]
MNDAALPGVTLLSHPLVQHKLTLLRQKDTTTADFRQITRELSLLMAYEVTRDLPLETVWIDTPLESMQAPYLAGKKLCFVPILRAGTGILDGMLDLVPSARVGHIGLYRDPETLIPVEYYLKLPEDISERLVILVDPMLATGHSAAAAVTRLRQAGAVQMRFVCFVAAPEGLAV